MAEEQQNLPLIVCVSLTLVWGIQCRLCGHSDGLVPLTIFIQFCTINVGSEALGLGKDAWEYTVLTSSKFVGERILSFLLVAKVTNHIPWLTSFFRFGSAAQPYICPCGKQYADIDSAMKHVQKRRTKICQVLMQRSSGQLCPIISQDGMRGIGQGYGRTSSNGECRAIILTLKNKIWTKGPVGFFSRCFTTR